MDERYYRSLEAKNSVLLLVDYQARMFSGAVSSNPTAVKNNVIAVAKGAEILDVPAVLTTISADNNGPFLPEVAAMFPRSPVIDRRVLSYDALADKEVYSAVNRTGRKQLVLSGLWTSMCMALTALRGLREGFNVFGVMDAASSESVDAHYLAVQRMVQAGVVPCTWMQVISEWMYSWQNSKAGELYTKVYGAYNGYSAQ